MRRTTAVVARWLEGPFSSRQACSDHLTPMHAPYYPFRFNNRPSWFSNACWRRWKPIRPSSRPCDERYPAKQAERTCGGEEKRRVYRLWGPDCFFRACKHVVASCCRPSGFERQDCTEDNDGTTHNAHVYPWFFGFRIMTMHFFLRQCSEQTP